MAGRPYDSHDIRSEMGYNPDVAEDVPAGSPAHPDPSLALTIVHEEPAPLDFIAPEEPGNALDVDALPDFSVLNTVVPSKPMTRRSKRQAGYNPDLTTSKRFRGKGQPSRPSLVDTEYSSGDDSSDADFELVPRRRRQPGTPSAGTSIAVPFAIFPKTSDKYTSTGEANLSVPDSPTGQSQPKDSSVPVISEAVLAFSDDEEASIAKFLDGLKQTKQHQYTATSHDSDNQSQQSVTSSSESSDASDAEIELVSETSADDTEEEEYVVEDVSHIHDNILNEFAEDYTLSSSYSSSFYSESAANAWEHYETRAFYENCNIDVAAYKVHNLVRFLQVRGLYDTVTFATPYCRQLVLEFYCNLTEAVKDPRYSKFGRAYVRGHIVNFSPAVINDYFKTTNADDAEMPELDEMTSVITGGRILKFPAHPQKLSAARLTSLYSVLHKTAVKTWNPSGNSTSVTKHQATVLYTIGTCTAFNFGRLIFDTVMAFAECGQVTYKLPYPSLIYALLLDQGILKGQDEELTAIGDNLIIAPALLRGNRKIDLPWSDTAAPENTQGGDATTIHTPVTFVPPSSTPHMDASFLKAQILHAEHKIIQARADLDYYEALLKHYQSLLDVGTSSGQKEGENGEEADAEDSSERTQF